jgi:aldose 1-epimerase
MNWRATRHEADYLSMSLVLHAQTGYPFVLSLQVSYALTSRGLEVETLARNIGSTPSPYGVGQHPYFTVGTDLIDLAFLEIPAQSYFLADERLIPTPPSVSVAGTRFDFRTTRAIGDVVLDTGYTDLVPDGDGFTRVKLSAPGGEPTITVFMDTTYQFLQVFTGDTLPVSKRRRSLAIEPYTCAPNAFNNGLGLRILQPGETFRSTWGMAVSD